MNKIIVQDPNLKTTITARLLNNKEYEPMLTLLRKPVLLKEGGGEAIKKLNRRIFIMYHSVDNKS
jgi:hypothetical protein